MARIPRLRSLVSAEGLVGALLAVIAIPQLLLGPGTDLDVGAVLGSGRLIMDGDYRPSRPPGAPVHEAIAGALEAVGGTTLSNMATLVAALAIVAAVVVLAREAGLSRPYLVAAVVVANPWFIVAATSTVDFPLALAFLLWGAIALQRDRTVVASVCFALAVGCRATTILLVMVVLVADVTGEQPKPRRALLCGALSSVLGLALYIPAFISAGGSLAFAQNDFSTASPGVMLGRALAKDLYFFGLAGAVVLLCVTPVLWAALRRWKSQWILRFGVLGVFVIQALFVRFPWKMGHLLPLLVCLALWLGVALRDRPQWLVALVVAQLLYSVVNLQLLEPDNPNDARGARAVLDLRWGVVVTDIACRADDTGAWKGDATRLEAVWNCAKPFGTGP
ncbi:MAG TPA: hypothetical protein VM282_26250 [Acidimicrobiales bacterium]|nr:hypothetical protein [Acidimicrobiales bacterium]